MFDWLEQVFAYIDPIKAGVVFGLVVLAALKAGWDSLGK